VEQQLSKAASRDPRKRAKDAQQARIVQALIQQRGIDRCLDERSKPDASTAQRPG